MKINFIIGVILVLLFLISCSQQEQIAQEPTEEKTTGLLTRTYTYEDENSTLKVIVNNLDNTGSVEMTMLIPDEEEWMYSLEEGTHQSDEVSEVFSITCEMLWAIYRDFDSAMAEFSETPWIDQSLTDEESKEQKEMTEFLKGFKATEFSITFTDKEDNSKVAECYNQGLEQEDIIYQGYSTTTQKEVDLGEQSIWDVSDGESYNEVTVYGQEEELTCPTMSNAGTFKFRLDQTSDYLWLDANFLTTARFSDDWELNYKPDSSEYSTDLFACEKGNVEGENINYLYCTPTYLYTPTLKKNTIDNDGNIINTDYMYITSFVFDAKGKDINDAGDLATLKLKEMICSESMY